MHQLIADLYERLTKRPYYTERSMVAEFGPPPAVREAQVLAELAKHERAKSAGPVPTFVEVPR